jgi:uncharacterized sulfatase
MNSDSNRPSFVIVMTDTQGTNACGAYGNAEALGTPHLERLAAQGVRFEHAYTTAPVCTPARSGLFTGVHPCKSGAWSNSMSQYDNIKTMGQRFRDEGYHTAYIGKWHLDGHDYFGTGECPDGWDPDYWYDGLNYIHDLGPEGVDLWRTKLKSVDSLRAHDVTRDFTWAGGITDRAVWFLENASQGDKPFVLVVSYDEPHAPFTCPPEFAEPFRDYWHELGARAEDDLAQKPNHQKEWSDTNINKLNIEEGRLNHPLYFGCNSFVDSEIGRVVDAVDTHTPNRAAVLYTSDHGDMLGAHQLTGKGPVMYDDITRIPLLVRLPEGNQAGFVSKTIASHVDILPTLLDLAGVERPDSLDGESLKPVLCDGHENRDKAAYIEFDRFEISNDSLGGFFPIRAIRKGNMKLVINLLDTDELYDLEADATELVNLINDPPHAAIRNRLHDELMAWMHERRDPFRSPKWERRPWRDSQQYGWWGDYRLIPQDGYITDVRDYFSGKVMTRGASHSKGRRQG